MSAFHFVLPAPAPTPIGGYKVVYEYANALVEAGVRVTVWHSPYFNAFDGGRPSPMRAVIMGAGVIRRRVRRPHAGVVSWFDLDDRVTVRLTAGPPRLSARAGDVVVATAVETTRYVGVHARRAGATSLAFIQHHETWAAPEHVIRDAWAEVDERVVIAPWLAELCASAGLTSVLLPNALDTASFPAGPPLSERRPMVLSLLSPHGYKRPDVVAETLNRVAAMRPDVRVVAFGIDRDPPRPLSAGAEYVADPSPGLLRQLYRDAVVYLCGSDAEGWHLPPAEATLSGAAVVSTDIGGVRASMGEDALYVPPGDSRGLAERVLEVLSAPSQAQARVDRAAARLRAVSYAGNAQRLKDIAREAGAARR